MLSRYDYTGRQFGQFEIESVIGKGEDVNLYSCLHISTGRSYVLRLDTNQNAWPEAPMGFPNNLNVVSDLIESYRIATAGLVKFKKESLFTVPIIYGLYEHRYLVPVTAPLGVKSAWGVSKLLQTPIYPNIYSYFELWEDVLSYLTGDAFIALKSPESMAKFEQKWGLLLGGNDLIESFTQFIANGSTSSAEQAHVISMVSSASHEDTFLVDNLLFRICACIERGALTPQEAIATLKCKYFRINISYHEVQQMFDLFSIFVSQELLPPDNSIKLIGFVLSQLENEPVNIDNNPDEFEKKDFLPYNQFTLFLLENQKNRKMSLL